MVENINKRREPFPLMSGVYFLSPTQNSVARLIDDFSLAAQPQYKEAHVFFSSALHPAMLGHIKACAGLVNRLKSLKEVCPCTSLMLHHECHLMWGAPFDRLDTFINRVCIRSIWSMWPWRAV